MQTLNDIRLYDEQSTRTLDTEEVAEYLQARTGCRAVSRYGPFSLEYSTPEKQSVLGEQIARLKVHDVDAPPGEYDPAYAEVEFERRRLTNRDRGPFGILYDGFGFQRLLRGLLPPDRGGLDRVHVVFTNRTIGTWDEDDKRYHLRAIVLGIPAIISTTGLVEAPAKPREFYLARQQMGLAARPELTHALLKQQFGDQFLDHDDPRLTQVAKGYAMQAVVYQVTGEAFCTAPDCRLFNAHWQRQLIRAQLEGPREYCARHEQLLAAMRRQARGA
ncbi:MAG: hypothetical protein JSV79_02045 [Armatimonadota bacterium]|nr:MAG: hypothetical protein JSV79_02045 [Armatimonadota bacterium]